MLHYIITDTTLTVLLNGIPKIIDASHPNYQAIKDAVKAGQSEDTVMKLIDTAQALRDYGEGRVQVINGEVIYNGKAVKSALTRRIITMMDEGFNVNGMIKFMDNMYNNPSKTAVEELYLFLEACNLPITEDGHFLAYKKVRENYKDIHSGTFDNSVGKECFMDRNEVDDNRNQTCSTGLHFASYSYMKSFGSYGSGTDRIVIVKINPADVVSIPSDYNNAKGRCCRYTVVNEVPNDTKTQIKDDCIKDSDAYSEEYIKSTGPTVSERILGILGKELKDITVKALYSNDITIDGVAEAVFASGGDVDEFYEAIEGLNFNQVGNVVRDLYLNDEIAYDCYIDDFYAMIEAGVAEAEEAKDEEQPTTFFESPAETIQIKKTVSEDAEKIIELIVDTIKAGTVEWNTIKMMSNNISPEMISYNDYNAIRRVLRAEFASGALSPDMFEIE